MNQNEREVLIRWMRPSWFNSYGQVVGASGLVCRGYLDVATGIGDSVGRRESLGDMDGR